MFMINLNSCYLYLLVSSPMLSSLPLSSSHALSANREISPPLPPFALFSSLTLFHHWLTCFTVQMSQNSFFSSSLSDFHPLCSGCTLNFDRTTEVAGQHWGKGGVEGWREQGGVEMWDSGRWSPGLDSRHKSEVFPRSKSGKILIQS